MSIRLLNAVVWVVAFLSLSASVAFAQVPATSGSTLQWEQNDTDAASLSYVAEVAGTAGTTSYSLDATVCNEATAPPTCGVALPDLQQGTYTLTLRAVRTIDGVDFQSNASAPLLFVRGDAPTAPSTIVIIINVGGGE